MVVQYVSDNNIGDHQFVSVKYTSDDREFGLVKEMEGGESVNCGQIKCRTMTPESVHATTSTTRQVRVKDSTPIYLIAMETADGELGDYCSHDHASVLDVESIGRVIRSLYEQVACLQKHGLCYTDIKPQNVLYTLADKKNKQSLRVLLGDMGSMGGICSFVCPFSQETLYPDCSGDGRFCQSFRLCVLALWLHWGDHAVHTHPKTKLLFDGNIWILLVDSPVDFLSHLRSDIIHFVYDTITTTIPSLAGLCDSWPSSSLWRSSLQFKPIYSLPPMDGHCRASIILPLVPAKSCGKYVARGSSGPFVLRILPNAPDNESVYTETHVIGTSWSTVIRVDNDGNEPCVYRLEYASLTNNNVLQWFSDNNNSESKFVGEEVEGQGVLDISKQEYTPLGKIWVLPEFAYDQLVCNFRANSQIPDLKVEIAFWKFVPEGNDVDPSDLMYYFDFSLDWRIMNTYVIHPQRDSERKDACSDYVTFSFRTESNVWSRLFGTKQLHFQISTMTDYRHRFVELNTEHSEARLDLDSELEAPVQS